MVGRYSFAVFSALFLLGIFYWSERLHLFDRRPTATSMLDHPSQPIQSRQASRRPASAGAIRPSENRPLEIEAVGE